MSFRVAALAMFAVAILSLWQTPSSLAQPGPNVPAPNKKEAAPKYQVIPFSHNSAVMIELNSGKSWKLERDPAKSGFVWVPIRKLDTDMELEQWKQQSEKAKAERRKRREAEFGEAIPLDVEPFGFRGGFEEAEEILEP
mgnify:CR=1 FL=1